MDNDGTQKQALEAVLYLCIDCALLIFLCVLRFIFVQKIFHALLSCSLMHWCVFLNIYITLILSNWTNIRSPTRKR